MSEIIWLLFTLEMFRLVTNFGMSWPVFVNALWLGRAAKQNKNKHTLWMSRMLWAFVASNVLTGLIFFVTQVQGSFDILGINVGYLYVTVNFFGNIPFVMYARALDESTKAAHLAAKPDSVPIAKMEESNA